MEALVASNILLWITVVLLSAVVLALVRQIGVLHERITPVGALVTDHGPRIGEAVPELELTDIEGKDIRIGGQHERGTLLFFLSPSCPVCKTLLPTALRTAAAETPPMDVVLASDGEPAEHRNFIAEHDLGAAPYVLSSTLGISYQVAKLPYAALIDSEGILRAKGLINTREHLESLFEAQRLGVASIQDYLDREQPQPEAMGNGGNA